MITKLQVKYIQSLGQKKFREESAVFVAEGPKIVNELLQANNVSPKTIFATRDWIQQQQTSTAPLPYECVEVDEHELQRISFLQTAHQVLGIFSKPKPIAFNPTGKISLLLDGIQDPGNMGTILRTADWFGINMIACSLDCADAFAPKVVQSTMGSIARVQVVYTDLAEMLNENRSLPVLGAALAGKNVYALETLSEAIIIIGNESKGISPALLERCTQRVTIPRIGMAESLNAAVAAGIILSQIAKPH